MRLRHMMTTLVMGALAIHAMAQTAPSKIPTTAPTTRAAHSTTQPSDSNLRSHPQWNTGCQRRVEEMQGKPCDVVFIGDSITDNFVGRPTPAWDLVGGEVWDKHYAGRNVLNFGVGADKTENVLWRLEHMNVKEFRPKVAVILIGTNNNQNTPEEIAAGVKAVIEKTRETFKNPKIILISILPNARATAKMEAANDLIKPLANEKGVFYFDLASKMPKEGNSWKGLGKDRLHLTAEAYELWASEMEPLLTKLLADK